MANPNASWLYKTGLLTIKGTSIAANPGNMLGLTTPETILSVLNNLAYGDSKKVMMETGSFNTNVCNYGSFYKYQFGYINSGDGSDGRFTIQGCPVSGNSYLSTDPPITVLDVSRANLRLSVPLSFNANCWNISSDNRARLFFAHNDRTFFGSQNGYSFRAAGDYDIASIDNNGNLYANASLATGGNINAGGTITASGNINASGVFNGNGSGLHSVHAVSADSAGSAGRANYADSAGSAPPDQYSPITLYNMSAGNSGGLTFIKVGENHYQHYNGWGHADWSFYTPPSGAVPGNFTPAIIVYSDGGSRAIFAVAQGSGNAANFNGSWGGVSDSNLKENIDSARDYTDDLCKLRVVKYNFINDPTYIPFVSTYTSTVSLFISSISTVVTSTVSVTVSTSKQRQIGFIAQEVQNIFPGLVEMNYFENPSTLVYTSCLSLKMSVLTPMLVTAIQNLKGRLDSHESTINGQTALIASLL